MPEQRPTRAIMAGTERTSKLTGFEALGLLTGTHRGGDWSGPLPELTGLSTDSRATRPGHLFAALPGSHAHGAAFIPAALAAGAAAILTDPAGLALAEAAGPARRAGHPARPAAPRARHRRQPLVRRPARGDGRRHRHQRQDLGRLLHPPDLGSPRRDRRQLRHRRRRGRGLGQAQPHHPRAGHPAPPARRPRRQGRHPRRDGGLLARPRPVPPRRRPPRRRRLHQHHPRPPRLPRRTSRPTSRPSSASSSACCPKRATAVVNLDDPHGPRVRRIAKSRGQRLVTTGRADGCDLRLLAQRFDADGQELLFAWGGKTHKVRLDLIGGFQAANALVSAGLAIGSGADPAAVIGVLPGLRTVRGRMERAARRQNGALVFVDYAHTPDALTTALTALRPHVMGRLVVVFGAGGDRDRGKRPLMGAAAAKAADLAYVTDDNPRTEDAGRDPRRRPRRRPRRDRDRRPRRGDPDRDRRPRARRRAPDRRQGPRDRPDRRRRHPALRRRRAGERRRRRPRRPRRMRRVVAPPATEALPLIWTRDEAVAATGGSSPRDWAATGVSIDTRTLRPGDLFVALTAARDGHDFVGAGPRARRRRRPRLPHPRRRRRRRAAPARPRRARRPARPRPRRPRPLRRPGRRGHRLGRQDRHQGDAAHRPRRAGPRPRRREELQQPLGRAPDPRAPAPPTPTSPSSRSA